MKRSALMIVANGQPFISYQLQHLYDLVDELIIVEGADKIFEQVIKSKRSNDGTIEAIHSFPDPEGKITLMHVNVGKNEMVRAGMSLVTGDNIYHVDVDEFLTKEAINMAFTILENTDVQCVKCPMHWYYKWQDVIIPSLPNVNRPEGEGQHFPRFYKNLIPQGLIPSHIPNTGYRTANNVFVEGRLAKLDTAKYVGWHYLSLYRFQVVDKLAYYSRRGDCTGVDAELKLNGFDTVTRSDIDKPLLHFDNRILTVCKRQPLFELPKTYR